MKNKLIIKEIEHTERGLLIKKCSILDSNTSEELRIAKLTPDLMELFKHIEIELDDYVKFMNMAEINPKLKKLVSKFNLTF